MNQVWIVRYCCRVIVVESDCFDRAWRFQQDYGAHHGLTFDSIKLWDVTPDDAYDMCVAFLFHSGGEYHKVPVIWPTKAKNQNGTV